MHDGGIGVREIRVSSPGLNLINLLGAYLGA